MSTKYALLAAMALSACAEGVDAPASTAVEQAGPRPIYMTLSAITPGGDVDIEVIGALPGRTVYVVAGLSLGQGPCTPHACSDVTGAVLVGAPQTGPNGIATLRITAPATLQPGDDVYMQAALVNPNATSLSPVVSTVVSGGFCATVDASDPYAARFEGTFFNNACTTDAECNIGGCSGEVCAAEPAFTTCELLPYLPTGSCGCVNNTCIWNDVCP